MLDVLNRELKYTALKQLLTTALAISMGESLLKYLPLGFNDLMYGYFRTLCVGYGIYAVANTMLLLLLYFTDYRGALAASVIFAVGNAPTALISLYELMQKSDWRPAFIIGVPVGFVNVEAAKELILKTDVPHIVNRGRKGGSNVAAAIVNALLYQIRPV